MLNDLSVPLADIPFEGYPDSTRVILVHPNCEHTRHLLNRLMWEGCYFRLQGRGLNRDQVDAQFTQALEMQETAIAAVKLLLIDEADRAEGDALLHLIRTCLASMAPQGRIVVFARDLPIGVMEEQMLRGVTGIYPIPRHGLTVARLSPVSEDAPTHTLEVYAFGSGRVLLNDRLITQWDGALPRALFFFMVDHGLVKRGEIFSLFWPTLSVAAATNVFHVTKRKMSEVLGVELTQHSSGFYHLARNIHLVYDVSAFLELLSQAENCSPDQMLKLLWRAVSLYRSGYLPSTHTLWSDARKSHLEALYVEALVTLGHLHQARGENRSALGMFARALGQDPTREELVLNVMTLYRELGQPQMALRSYDRLHDVLERTARARPTHRVQALAESLRESS